MKHRRSSVLPIALAFLLLPSISVAVPFDGEPKVLLHLRTPITKNRCAAGILADCTTAVTSGGLYPQSHLVYVLVARGNLPDISGVQFGIDYDPGLYIQEWVGCASIEYQSSGWPASGTGNMVTWNWTTGCPTGETAVAGYFYLTAYDPGSIRVVPRQVDCSVKVARCPDNLDHSAETIETVLDVGDLGVASFGGGGGCNPCNQDCGSPPVPSPPTGLTATSGCGDIDLAWNPVAGADRYRIYRDGSPMPVGASITGTSFTDEDPDAGQHCYQVATLTCAGGLSPLSAAACASTNLGVSIDQSPAGGSFCAPNAMSLTATATGAGTWQWRKNGGAIANGGRVSGAQTANLLIDPLAAGDAGSYDAIVTNACGSDTSTAASVVVCARPAISWNNASLYYRQPNTSLNLSLSLVPGCDPVSFQWFRGGSPLVDGPRIGGAHTPTLSLSALQTADTGYYYCVLSNSCGTTTSRSTYLFVRECVDAPAVTQQPGNVSVPLGNPASFTFGVSPPSGTCGVRYRWYRNNSLIPAATSATLFIPSVAEEDAGAYRACASSSGPAVCSRTVTLNIARPVFVRSTARVDPADCNRVLVEWEANVPVTTELSYGFASSGGGCGLTQQHEVTTLQAANSASFIRPGLETRFCYQIRISDAGDRTTVSSPKSIGMPGGIPQFWVSGIPLPALGTLAGPNDAIHVNVDVGTWCYPTSGPIRLVYARLHRPTSGAFGIPRNPANPNQFLPFPQVIAAEMTVLDAARHPGGLWFRLSDLSHPPEGERLYLRGRVDDSSSPARTAWLYRTFPTPPPAGGTTP